MEANKKNINSFFERISDSTKTNPASNVSQIKIACSVIMVKNKRIDFDRKDDIFKIKKTIEICQNNSVCNLCDKEVKKKKYCEFCGYYYCKDCCYKERSFNSSEGSRGKICMICDRKFIAKEIQKFYEEQIDNKEVKIKISENKLKEQKEKLEEAQHKLQERIQEDEKNQKDFEADMEDLSAKMEVIQNRIKEITNENEILTKRLQTKNDDANRKQEEKNRICMEIDDIKSETNSLTIRLEKLNKRYSEVYKNKRGTKSPHQGVKKESKIKKNIDTSENLQSIVSDQDNFDDAKSKSHKKKNKRSNKDSLVTVSSKNEMVSKSKTCKDCIIF